METVPFIPLVAPSRGGLAIGEKYPPGEIMKPAAVDTVVRASAVMMSAVLLVTRVIVPCIV
jgi:hypothetical protein